MAEVSWHKSPRDLEFSSLFGAFSREIDTKKYMHVFHKCVLKSANITYMHVCDLCWAIVEDCYQYTFLHIL